MVYMRIFFFKPQTRMRIPQSQPNKIKVPFFHFSHTLFTFATYFLNFSSRFFFFFFVVHWRCYCWASNFVCIHKFGMKSCVTLAAASMRRHFHQDLHYFAYIDAILLIHSQPAIQFDYHLCDAVWCGLVAI